MANPAPSDPKPLNPDQLDRAIGGLGPPPVGIVLISMTIHTDQVAGSPRVDGGSSTDRTDPAHDLTRDPHGGDATAVTDAAASFLADQIRPPDLLAIDETGRIVVARAGLRAPAATDGLAYNLYDELSRTTIVGDRAVRWQATVGAATSLDGDSGSDVLDYAGRALDEAHLLGGDRVVVFDDVDRALLPDG